MGVSQNYAASKICLFGTIAAADWPVFFVCFVLSFCLRLGKTYRRYRTYGVWPVAPVSEKNCLSNSHANADSLLIFVQPWSDEGNIRCKSCFIVAKRIDGRLFRQPGESTRETSAWQCWFAVLQSWDGAKSWTNHKGQNRRTSNNNNV